jgi:hypothetical protein
MLKPRAQSRERAFILAKISAENSDYWCTVTDISRAGAKLHFVGAVPRLPSTFDIEVAAPRESRKAQVIWRRGQEIGVMFHL